MQSPKDFEQVLTPSAFGKVLHTLCEDLLMGMRDRRLLTGHIDDATLTALLDEVTDAVLRHKVLYFADAAATADQHVASAEAWVMEAALKRWQTEEAVARA